VTPDGDGTRRGADGGAVGDASAAGPLAGDAAIGPLEAVPEVERAVERIVAAAEAARDPVRREGGVERPAGKKAARTRASLLAAAYEVFSRQGYQRTAVGEIAEAAGVSLGTFYQYFRDRADIMTALVGTGALDILRGNRAPWDPARGRDGLRRVIARFVATYAATAPFQEVWEEVTHVEPQMATLRRDLARVFTGVVADALRAGADAGLVRGDLDHAHMAAALTSMVDRYCYVAFVFDPPEGGAPSVDEVVDVLTALWADAIGLADGEDAGAGGAGGASA
jgi:AcrR family transcriptional regulator